MLASKDRDEIIYNYRSTWEELKQAQAQLHYFLKMTSYKAPYDGYPSEILVSPGAFVENGEESA